MRNRKEFYNDMISFSRIAANTAVAVLTKPVLKAFIGRRDNPDPVTKDIVGLDLMGILLYDQIRGPELLTEFMGIVSGFEATNRRASEYMNGEERYGGYIYSSHFSNDEGDETTIDNVLVSDAINVKFQGNLKNCLDAVNKVESNNRNIMLSDIYLNQGNEEGKVYVYPQTTRQVSVGRIESLYNREITLVESVNEITYLNTLDLDRLICANLHTYITNDSGEKRGDAYIIDNAIKYLDALVSNKDSMRDVIIERITRDVLISCLSASEKVLNKWDNIMNDGLYSYIFKRFSSSVKYVTGDIDRRTEGKRYARAAVSEACLLLNYLNDDLGRYQTSGFGDSYDDNKTGVIATASKVRSSVRMSFMKLLSMETLSTNFVDEAKGGESKIYQKVTMSGPYAIDAAACRNAISDLVQDFELTEDIMTILAYPTDDNSKSNFASNILRDEMWVSETDRLLEFERKISNMSSAFTKKISSDLASLVTLIYLSNGMVQDTGPQSVNVLNDMNSDGYTIKTRLLSKIFNSFTNEGDGCGVRFYDIDNRGYNDTLIGFSHLITKSVNSPLWTLIGDVLRMFGALSVRDVYYQQTVLYFNNSNRHKTSSNTSVSVKIREIDGKLHGNELSVYTIDPKMAATIQTLLSLGFYKDYYCYYGSGILASVVNGDLLKNIYNVVSGDGESRLRFKSDYDDRSTLKLAVALESVNNLLNDMSLIGKAEKIVTSVEALENTENVSLEQVILLATGMDLISRTVRGLEDRNPELVQRFDVAEGIIEDKINDFLDQIEE